MQTHLSFLFYLPFLLSLLSFTTSRADEFHVLSAELSHQANLHMAMLAQKNGGGIPDNETIHRATKELCLGCAVESLEFLFAHNWVRARKLQMPLIWDSELEKYAKWWAMQRKGDCSLQHSFRDGDFKFGENIFWGTGTDWTPSDAVNDWANEEKYYDYATNTCQDGQMCGHYTQVVWSETRRVGCGRVSCDDGGTLMTCNYAPQGNFEGERPF